MNDHIKNSVYKGLLSFNSTSFSKSDTSKVASDICNTTLYIYNNFVDLELPSRTLWAKCNIGANSPEEDGDYFLWGSTESNSNSFCDWDIVPFNDGKYEEDIESFMKYFNSASNELPDKYDYAYIYTNGIANMPTSAQILELIKNCTLICKNINGVNGILFTSNINNETLFFPLNGSRVDNLIVNKDDTGIIFGKNFKIDHNKFSVKPEVLCLLKILTYGRHAFIVKSSRKPGAAIRPVVNP